MEFEEEIRKLSGIKMGEGAPPGHGPARQLHWDTAATTTTTTQQQSLQPSQNRGKHTRPTQQQPKDLSVNSLTRLHLKPLTAKESQIFIWKVIIISKSIDRHPTNGLLRSSNACRQIAARL
ncbi:unnamed protein product, partial [Mesorhabditis belari]|uniref:Uncharacterized protein n=1 Tax=Mesorhabditis belari TaxID=2138241 RepID=A0AAF3J3M5_9BILA